MAVKTIWEVVHVCGHTETHDLSSKPVSERAGYARWLARKDCSACWSRNREAEWTACMERRAEELVEVESWENWTTMPILEGSERAVEWARRVRYNLLCTAWGAVGMTGEAFRSRIEVPARAVRSALWWIDQRDCNPIDLEELLGDAAAAGAAISVGSGQ